MSENQPANVQLETNNNGTVSFATDVIATIVGLATTEVEGISGIAGSGAISGILAKGKTPRGVKVDMDGENVDVDVSVTVDYGMPIQKVGRNAQENVRKSIESMTGLHVEKVDLHVVGVSFEKENQEMQQIQKLALTIEEEKEHPSLEEAIEEDTAEAAADDDAQDGEQDAGIESQEDAQEEPEQEPEVEKPEEE